MPVRMGMYPSWQVASSTNVASSGAQQSLFWLVHMVSKQCSSAPPAGGAVVVGAGWNGQTGSTAETVKSGRGPDREVQGVVEG
mmetsp:Transcript_18818/g.61185  ORF Transcript_18818/g.61185 Transcript_18818/m.61185 type:complete len:83 (+) Transcript_18818:567-815(+)